MLEWEWYKSLKYGSWLQKPYDVYGEIQCGLENLTEFKWVWGEEWFTNYLKELIQKLD